MLVLPLLLIVLLAAQNLIIQATPSMSLSMSVSKATRKELSKGTALSMLYFWYKI